VSVCEALNHSLLQVRRLPLADLPVASSPDAPTLGALVYGTVDRAPWIAPVDAERLGDGPVMADLWQASGELQSGGTEAARWRTDGHWTLGAIDLDEHDQVDLEALAYQGYRHMFEAMRQAGTPHLLRIWNYLPRINEDGGGLERYRQFNVGRQRAFVDAGLGVLEGAPAACALGLHRGGLSIRFLAGRSAPVAVENPRQVSAYRYPADYGPRPPLFSRAALADLGGGQVALFISGTASIVGHASVHLGDVAGQTRETLRNLQAVVDASHRHGTARYTLDGLHLVVYVRHPSQVPTVRKILERALGENAAALRHAVFLKADICRHDLLVEIEAHAVAPGALTR
jgi:chorismate lyase/3-hydroxybenzoate synthase